jgi:polyisoprenoid-binding protein YceI
MVIQTASIRTHNERRDNDLRTVVNYGDFNDPNMGHRIGYGAETQILRKDFGLNVDMLMDGRLVIGNEIQITIQGELVEANVPAAATS